MGYINHCSSDTIGSKYVPEGAGCAIWQASGRYVGDILDENTGGFDDRSFFVGLTAFETIDPLDGNHDKCRLWQDYFFSVLGTKIRGVEDYS